MQCLNIPQPPNLNQIINSARGNKYKAANLKKQWTEAIAQLSKDLKPIQNTCWVALNLTYTRTNCDPDNLQAGTLKVALDGLVKAGILQGDSVKHIKSPVYTSYNKGKEKLASIYLFEDFNEYSRYILADLDKSSYPS